ncbi:hypothetical protein CL634_08820, partial [bacterium]|nr:hypothetical protein [bacterium]
KKQEELEERLVRENYGLVVSQALLFFKEASFTLEDYIQVGLIGLLKSIRKYDKNKSKFSTFASVCIRNEITNFVKKSKKKNKIIFDTTMLNKALGKKQYLSKDSIIDYLPNLNQEELFIITKKIENYTNAEISDMIFCTKESLSNKIVEIINKLQKCNQ